MRDVVSTLIQCQFAVWGGTSSKQELNRAFETDWEEDNFCNNVKYVKTIKHKSNSKTPQKQNQEFVKGYRTPKYSLA